MHSPSFFLSLGFLCQTATDFSCGTPRRFTLSGRILGGVGGPSCAGQEEGPAGVKLTLTPVEGGEPVASVSTAPGGNYKFENLLTGSGSLCRILFEYLLWVLLLWHTVCFIIHLISRAICLLSMSLSPWVYACSMLLSIALDLFTVPVFSSFHTTSNANCTYTMRSCNYSLTSNYTDYNRHCRPRYLREATVFILIFTVDHLTTMDRVVWHIGLTSMVKLYT